MMLVVFSENSCSPNICQILCMLSVPVFVTFDELGLDLLLLTAVLSSIFEMSTIFSSDV